jgi:two-component system LytT family response regulator
MSVRTLIVDDEPLARERIRTLLAGEPDVVVVGECTNGREAVRALRGQPADLVFLDVQMPGRNAFEVIADVGPERMPAVVFVTAYDEYALRAFEVHAVDYLLKPFDAERFHEALRRARARVKDRDATGAGTAAVDGSLLALLHQLAGHPARADRLAVRSSGGIAFVGTDDVDYAEACGNYVRLHCGAARHLMRETMLALEARLDPRRFARIHRSTLVNLDRVKELHPLFHGDWELVLANGTRLTLTRHYREHVQQLLAGKL